MKQDDSEYYNPEEEDKQIDEMIAQGVAAATKGENISQLLEVILAAFSPEAKEKIRKKFSASLGKRGLKMPAADADIPSRATLVRIRDIFTLTAKQALDRIASLTRSRPDIAQTIKQAGEALMRNGVVVDKVQVSEADLGTMAPSAGLGKGQGQGTGRA
jgi:hypothetical protein